MSTALLEREPAWAEVTAGEEPGDHPARDLDSCYARAIAAITGTEVTDPGMGMEWRLMPIGGTSNPEKSAAAKRPDRPLPPPPADPSKMVRWGETVITAELSHALQRVASGYKYVLPEAGIVSLDQVAAMSDDELLAIDRGWPWHDRGAPRGNRRAPARPAWYRSGA